MSATHTRIYSELDASVQQIRLIRLKRSQNPDDIYVELETYQIDQCPPYNALSYAWGDQNKLQLIDLNGIRHAVTTDLHSALKHLRPQLEDQLMWIDALCINQQDVKEREFQVSLMRRIYSQAYQVTVWLGEQSHDSDLAFDFLHMLSDQDEPVDWFYNLFQIGKLMDGFIPFVHLYARSYWRRLWIVQEIAMGAQVQFHCGSRSASLQLFDTFHAAVEKIVGKIQEMLRKEMVQDRRDDLLIRRCTEFCFVFSSVFSSVGLGYLRKAADATSLLKLLRFFRISEATDPRDKIYGLLGLKNMDPPFVVDYSVPVATVYRRFAREVITRSGKFDIFSDCYPDSRFSRKEFVPKDSPACHSLKAKLPSWVPDWNQCRGQKFSFGPSHSCASGNSPPSFDFIGPDDEEHLKVKGFCIGKITYCSEPSKFGLAGSSARSFVDTARLVYAWRLDLDQENIDASSDVKAFCRLIHPIEAYPRMFASIRSPVWAREQLSLIRQGRIMEEAQWPKDRTLFSTIAYLIAGRCLCFSHSAKLDSAPSGFGITEPPRLKAISGSGSTRTISLAPAITQAGDLLCIFLGHNRPVVLRPLGDEHGRTVYRFIGEADSYDFEDGQGMDGLRNGFYHLQDFELV
ncbi:MAG: hypothetical protein Q9202_002360 [Teloschistes flavicans]